MEKIFISHSSEDEVLVRDFVEFIQMGMGFSRDDIFCTSYQNELLTGKGFVEKIRQEVSNAGVFFLVITEAFLKSPFCLAEMGAAWVLCKQMYPILLVDLDKLERTPLKGLQVRFMHSEEDINAIYDELCRNGVIRKQNTTEYMHRLKAFMKKVQEQTTGEYLLEISEDGYYHTEIVEVRNVRPEYRCYRIKGHIADWKTNGSAASDWIFYRAGVYADLSIGQKIRFKISKTEVKWWSDIGFARNIYPADLRKEENKVIVGLDGCR